MGFALLLALAAMLYIGSLLDAAIPDGSVKAVRKKAAVANGPLRRRRV